jgi:hypothetical protein
MASTYRLDSHSYQGRYMYLSCTQTKDIATNTSKIDWKLTVTGGTSNYYATGPTTIKINGETIYYKAKTNASTQTFPAAKGSISGVTTVAHDNVTGEASVEVSIKTNIYTGVLKTTTGTWTLDSIPRFATISSAPDFNDEENPTLVYSNPAGNNVELLRACISLDGTNADIAYRNIDKAGTSYVFNLTEAERDVLRAATVGSNSRRVSFHLYTLLGGVENYESVEKVFTIKNPNPVIRPSVVDVNSNTIALTGDSSKLIKYHSNAKVTIGASAVKKASLVSKSVSCAGNKLLNDGTINAVESNVFVFTATDNRKNTTTYQLNVPFVNYTKLTCSLANRIPDAAGTMDVVVTGNYFNESFGAQQNSIEVKYRYKATGESFGPWISMGVTPINNTYYASAKVTGLDYQTAYVFQAYAEDKLETANAVEKTVKATPVFDWGEYDFKFNVPVYDEFNTIIRNGKAEYTGIGTDAVDPNTTTEELCLTDHANVPRPGYWFFIRTMVYGDPKNSEYRAQTAYPAGATMSLYHRTYSSGVWSAWRRVLNEDEKFTQIKLLWTNASTTSSFANQTLSVDLSDYDLVYVEFLTNCSTGGWKSYRITMTVPVNHDTEWKNYKAVGFTESGANIGFRAFHMGNNTIRFGESYYASSYATSLLTTNNNLYIPLRIYGIKGVS